MSNKNMVVTKVTNKTISNFILSPLISNSNNKPNSQPEFV
uniref:Uncharacterized protein n=1 Tax=Rhizophora mucronata TaxID=61149 RepID=A0A2P2PGQ1_RHIMU